MNLKHTLLAILVAAIWGSNFVVIDAGMVGMPPLLFVALRFVLVVFPLIFFLPRPNIRLRAVAGIGLLMSAGQFGLLYLAMSLGLPAGLASLVLQAQVLLTVVISAMVLREKPSRRQLSGVILGVVGLVIVAVGHSAVAPVLPLILVLAASLSWACGNVLARFAKASSGLSLVVWSGAVVPLPLTALSLLVDGPAAVVGALTHISGITVLSVLFTAYFSSVLGYGIWNTLLKTYPTSAVVPFTLLVPPVGIVAAALAFHEVPTVTELSGGALLLLGVAAAVVRLPTWRRRSLTDAALVRHEPPAELPAELAVGATADSRASRS